MSERSELLDELKRKINELGIDQRMLKFCSLQGINFIRGDFVTPGGQSWAYEFIHDKSDEGSGYILLCIQAIQNREGICQSPEIWQAQGDMSFAVQFSYNGDMPIIQSIWVNPVMISEEVIQAIENAIKYPPTRASILANS